METKVTLKDYLKVFLTIVLIFIIPALVVWQVSEAKNIKQMKKIQAVFDGSGEVIQEEFSFLRDQNWEEMLSNGGDYTKSEPDLKNALQDGCAFVGGLYEGQIDEYFTNYCAVYYITDDATIEVHQESYFVNNRARSIREKLESVVDGSVLVEGGDRYYFAYMLVDGTDNILVQFEFYTKD